MENTKLAHSKTIKKKKKLGAYPSISVVFSITLAVLVIGIFGIMLVFYQSQSDIIKKNITIHIYLDKELSNDKIESIRDVLSKKEYTLKNNEGKAVIQFIDKEEAAKRFIAETGEDFSKLLGDNPLRDAFLLNVSTDYSNTQNLKRVKKSLERMDGIYEVVYFENLVENINNIIPKIGLALLAIAMMLTLISIFLIHNSIRLALFSQRFLIRSMQLIGAKSSFIRWPFLKRALWLGLIAGLLAATTLFLIINGLDRYLDDFDIHLHIYGSPELILGLFSSMVLVGCIIGFLSTYMAVNKYLKMKLEELY
ncbi:MAG TPA: permease-like cell division protein FtsX [Cytophagales bacterium]|nr:permease-like cell division protein FtsX [Cytophagales bacterium]